MSNCLFSGAEKIFLGTPSISIGSPVAAYPITNIADNVMGTYATIVETTGAMGLDLITSKAPDYVACFNHNITSGVVRIQGSDSDIFSALIVDVAITITPLRNFWKDLRAIGTRTARYWRVKVTTNAAPLRIGELVVGTVDTVRSHNWDYTDHTAYLVRDQGISEWDVMVSTKRGIVTRGRSLTFTFPNDSRAIMKRLLTNVGAPIIMTPLLFFPNDEDQTDVWMLEVPETYGEEQDLDNMQTMNLELQEQSPGL